MAKKTNSDAQWYCRIAGGRFGPLSTVELRFFAKRGALSPGDLVKAGRDGAWIEAGTIEGLFAHHDKRQRGRASKSGSKAAANAAYNLIKNTRLRQFQSEDQTTTSSISSNAVSVLQSVASLAIERTRDVWNSLVDWLFFLRWDSGLNKITLVILAIVLFVLIIPNLPIGWTWPKDPHEVYTAIWEELKDLRERKASDVEWREFAERATHELTPVVARLEKTMSVKDPEALQLLRAGRDYLPRMLQDARENASESEQQFAEYLRTARFASSQDNSRMTGENILTSFIVAIDACALLFFVIFMTKRIRSF